MDSNPLPTVPVLCVRIGRAEPFGPHGERSAIRKQPIGGSVVLGRLGLVGDEQGDRRHHGGPDKALHHYPFDHYATWQRELPAHASTFKVGAFGENLSASGLIECNVCIGDVFRLGTSTLQVSQARQPCWKLNLRFGQPDMARRVQDSGRTGWYYRVVDEGVIGPGDSLELIERHHPEWTLSRVLRVLYGNGLDADTLIALARLESLASSWRALATRRLETGEVEDWSRRLDTPV